ncbi:hypothetical protein GCM10027048_35720 [Hymenobacter coalescens]
MFKHILLTCLVAASAGAALAQQAPLGKPTASIQATGPASRGQKATRPTPAPAPLVLAPIQFSASVSLIRNLHDLGTFETFVQSAERAVLVIRLQNPGPYTVFAPTDDAFAKLPPDLLADLWNSRNRARLQALLHAHIVSADLKEHELTDGRVLTTLAGTTLKVRRVGGRVQLEDDRGKRAYLSSTNHEASNGTVHVLDAVLSQP